MQSTLPYWFSSDSHDDARETRRAGTPQLALHADADAPMLAVSPTDRALAAQIQSGDEAAFSEMYLSYYAALAEYAAGIVRDASTAHDVVQEIFLNIWRDRSAWDPGNVAAYLYRATRNRALNDIGGERRRARLQAEHDRTTVRVDERAGSGEPPLAPDEALHVERFQRALAQAIDALPVPRREVAILRWRHGRSLAEIAVVTGSSVKAVSMQLARTRDSLQPIVNAYVRDE